jgi:hypothetical protein
MKCSQKINVQSESTDADDLSSFTKANAINLHGQSPTYVSSDGAEKSSASRTHDFIGWRSISPMSVPERVFSGARRTISWDKHNLTSKNVEMIESLASWIKEGIVGHLNVDNSLEELIAGMELRDDDESE